MQIQIERFCHSQQMGTFAKLTIFNDMDKVFTCFTVEQPWNDNKPFISCIPCGAYTLVDHSSEKYGETYAIVGDTVEQYKNPANDLEGINYRYACLFHAANIYTSVSGCVGLGASLGFLNGLWAVTNSKQTTNKFLEILKNGGGKHSLLIFNNFC